MATCWFRRKLRHFWRACPRRSNADWVRASGKSVVEAVAMGKSIVDCKRQRKRSGWGILSVYRSLSRVNVWDG